MKKRKKTGAILLYCCALLVLLELGARLSLAIVKDVPVMHPDKVFASYYPETRQVLDQEITATDGYYDVLLLGASVLGSQAEAIEKKLRKRLGPQSYRIRVHDLSVVAHTSLDSWYKYQYLRDKAFDLVIFCHGINEVRANNIPGEYFRNDYSHYAWYREIAIMARHWEMPYVAAPYLLHLGLWKVRQKIAGTRLGRLLPPLMLVPVHHPRPEWVPYGSEIKSAEPFAANLDRILALARDKGERVLVTTFAYYSPENYSKEAFEAGELDYAENRGMPTEVWGEPDNVVAGIQAHNAIVRLKAAENDVLFIDMEKDIPKEGGYFVDICHLSKKGTELFSGLVAGAIAEAVAGK